MLVLPRVDCKLVTQDSCSDKDSSNRARKPTSPIAVADAYEYGVVELASTGR